jgi:DNA polymerase-3 subunit alpha
MPLPYVALHTHSQFSLLEASARVSDLITVAQAHQSPALALTDSGNLYGAVQFYQKAQAAGIKPIIGVELAVVEGDHTDRQTRQPTHQVTLLANSLQGYQHLCHLVSEAHTKGFYYRPRINYDTLLKHHEGLTLLTDCQHGPIGYNVLRGHVDKAESLTRRLKDVFDDRLLIELQDHGLGTEMQVNAFSVELAKKLGSRLVVTNDARFAYAGQKQAVDILLCMQQGKTINDTLTRSYNEHYYQKSGDELAEGFSNLDTQIVRKAIETTVAVADSIAFDWPMGESLLPAYPLPAGETEESYLHSVTFNAAREKVGQSDGTLSPAYHDRLLYELGVINQMGFPAYFLIVWDFIAYARQKGIPVGPGRGSAAGSLVAYVLGITNLDPVKHNLLFERFLNPERVSMPDIDIDFCIERRGDVIDYVGERYGRERVCQIATFGTLAAKAAVKAVARVLAIPYAESDRIAKMIPGTPGTKLQPSLDEVAELKAEYDGNPEVKNWLDLALLLEGTACNVGTHAAGVVIAKDPLTQVIPVQNSKDNQLISQFTMGDLEALGLLKMDFLGLRNLTIIDNTLKLVAKHEGQTLVIDDVPLDDPDTYTLLAAGETDGVFQLESGGMKQLVKDLKPSTFEDINALVALYRPGPLNSGMVSTFVNRKHGREAVSFPHPLLEPILKDTYGTIVYQEQIMQIAQVLGGYSLGQADLLRRAMGKKKAEVMAKERDGFIAGTTANNVDDTLANELFDTMTEFAAYCFNRSHSAAYAFVAFQTAYLKAHHPVAYVSALLSSVSDNLDKVQHYMMMARRMGIKVLPPDVNTSDATFTPTTTLEGKGAIRFGLATTKNVGLAVVEGIIDQRNQGGAFKGMDDFLKRVNPKALNRKTLESLILSGAFDTLGHSRKQLFNNMDSLASFAERHASQAESGQVSLFDLLGSGTDDEPNTGGLLLSGSPTDEYLDDELQRYEKDYLGFYVSSHPLDSVRDVLPMVTSHTLAELAALPDGSEVRVGGLVTQCVRRLTKKGKPMLVGMLEDMTTSQEFIAFGNEVDELATVVEAGKRALVKAKVSKRQNDDDDTERFSLMLNSAQPLEAVEPIVIPFEKPPTIQELHALGEQLKQRSGSKPVVLAFPDGTRIQTGAQFWVAG